MKISYNWLQDYFESNLPEPEKISEGIIFHSFEVEEVERFRDDIIFDIKVLPDRAHDCLSHFGIAKEISAIFDIPLKNRLIKDSFKKDQADSLLQIEILDDRCLRYMGKIVRNVKVSESPEWLKERLMSIGQKSINNIVDVANFIMFDLGQPIHAFDLDKMISPKIIVRSAKEGENMTTLDKKEISLDQSMLVIADERQPLALAGIKGGTAAEVDKNTKNIIIEVANFDPVSTRKTAKKVNILTDAVKRYENEISPELCKVAMDYVSQLIVSLSSGEEEKTLDVYPNKKEKRRVPVSVDYINKRLGSSFAVEEIESVWKKLGFEYLYRDNVFEITVPDLRLDITGPHDLSEEVIRILGYERLEEKMPEINSGFGMEENFSKMLLVREELLKGGYSEVMTYVFRDKGELEVLASASDKKFLRTNLSDGLNESLKLNQLNAPLLGMKEIKIFEIGTVFKKGGEEMHVAFGDKKGIKEMTINGYVEMLGGQENLVVPPASGVPHEQDFLAHQLFKPWSPFPFVARDIAVWVQESVKKEEVEKIIRENTGNMVVRGPELFDEFKKDGNVSYAFRIIFQSFDRTLTDEEVNMAMETVNNKIKEKGWRVR